MDVFQIVFELPIFYRLQLKHIKFSILKLFLVFVYFFSKAE